jgi:cell division inhibitor SulA
MVGRKVSPEQFAEELEKHLLGTESKWAWDDTTSIALADERLDRIRLGLTKFDLLTRTKNREQLEAVIAALRRGEFPEIS